MDRLTLSAAARISSFPPDFSSLTLAATRRRYDDDWSGQRPAPAGPLAPRPAWVYLWDRGIHGWMVDLKTKRVTARNGNYDGLIEYAQYYGWE